MAKRKKKTKAQRRAIANRNLAKARRARWKGHRKQRHRKLTKAQRRKVAMTNLEKAWRSHGKRKHGHGKGRRLSPKAQKWISNKIRFLMKKERRSQKQAVAMAYAFARKRGFKVPRRPSR